MDCSLSLREEMESVAVREHALVGEGRQTVFGRRGRGTTKANGGCFASERPRLRRPSKKFAIDRPSAVGAACQTAASQSRDEGRRRRALSARR
jgi:hypothetical protein